MRSFTFLVASALVAVASAQSSTTTAAVESSVSSSASVTTSAASSSDATASDTAGSTQSQFMPPSATAGFNINNVTDSDKANYCLAQRNSCRSICGGSFLQNDCTQATLTYACTCYNGTVPDMTRYTETIPYFECIDTRAQCINNHPNDLDGQEACEKAAVCGTITPPELGATDTTTTMTSGTGGATSSGSSGSATSTTTSGIGAMVYSTDATTGAFATLLMALFGVFL